MWMVDNICWVQALRLQVLADELIDKSCSGARVAAINVALHAEFVEESVCLLSG